MHLLYLDVNQRFRLHQAAIERQVLGEPGYLVLHVAQTSFNLLVAFAVDAPRHLGPLELLSLAVNLLFQVANARARRLRAAHRIDHAVTRLVAAEFEDAIKNGVAPGRVRSHEKFAEQVRHQPVAYVLRPTGADTRHYTNSSGARYHPCPVQCRRNRTCSG